MYLLKKHVLLFGRNFEYIEMSVSFYPIVSSMYGHSRFDTPIRCLLHAVHVVRKTIGLFREGLYLLSESVPHCLV